MKTWIRCFAVLVVALFARASAQTYTYYVDEVTTVSKPVLITPGYMTIIEFYDDVDQVMSGRPNLVKIAGVTGSKLFLTALLTSGTTDLVVDVAQRSHLFRLTVAQGSAPRRYVILNRPKPSAAKPATPATTTKPAAVGSAPKPTTSPAKPTSSATPVSAQPPAAKPTQSPARPAVPASSPRNTVAASPLTAGANLLNRGAELQSAPASRAPNPTPAATTRAQVEPPTAGASVNPAWLDLAVRHLQAGPLEGQYTVLLVIRNTGTRTVVLDGDSLRFENRDGGARYSITDTRATLTTLEPGQVSAMRVVVEGPLPRELTINWLLYDLNSETAYLLKRGLNVEDALARR